MVIQTMTSNYYANNLYRKHNPTPTEKGFVLVRGIKYKCNENGSLTLVPNQKNRTYVFHKPRGAKSIAPLAKSYSPIAPKQNYANEIAPIKHLSKYHLTVSLRKRNASLNPYKLTRKRTTWRFNRKTTPVKNTLSKSFITTPRLFKGEEVKRHLSLKALRSSIALLRQKSKLKLSSDNRQYCMFFCRFGRCNRKTCPYKHDPDKVIICTRFLRGSCKINACPFSHELSPEKMPVCQFFLRGICDHEACPYRHVKVAEGAKICEDFNRGFCAKRDECDKLHQYKCVKCANSSKKLRRCAKCQSLDTKLDPEKSKKLRKRKIVKNRRKSQSDEKIEYDSDESQVMSKQEVQMHELSTFIPMAKSDYFDDNSRESPILLRDMRPIKRNIDYDSDDSWFVGESEDPASELIDFLPSCLRNMTAKR